MSEFVLSAAIEMKDKFTSQIEKARTSCQGLVSSLQATDTAVTGASAGLARVGKSGLEAAAKIDKTKKSLAGIKGVYSATVRAKDEATQTVRKVRTELNAFKSKTYTAVLNVKQNMPNVSSKMSGVASGMMMGLPMQAAGAAGIGFGIFDAIKNYSDFTAQLSQIKAVTGLDAEAMDAVKSKALELGATTRYSSTEAAQGMTELLKAGVDVKDVLGDASQAALDLAAAGDLSLPEAAEIMSTAMNAFHMDNSTHAADILAGAANASATSVGELKYSLAACAAVAAGAGMSFDDTNTALAVFAQNGLKGSDAGTSLKTMLANLSPKTSSATKTFEKLGLMTEQGTSKFYDAEGHMKSLADVAGILQDKMAGMTDEEKMNTLYDMFGSDAIRGGMILLREGADGVKKMNDAMKDVTAHETAKVAMDNLKGSLYELKSVWENLTIKLLNGGAGEGIRNFVQEASKLTKSFSGLLDDGFQLTDVIKVMGQGFVDLKDKALAFDGVGSILAGGALIVGLKKIYTMAMKAKNGLQDLAKSPMGKAPTGGGTGGQSTLRDMVVNAKSVVVNGAVGSGGTSGGTILGPDGKPVKNTPGKSPAPKTPAGGWLSKIPGIGAAVAIGSSLMDIAYAPEGQRGTAAAGAAGGLAGMWAGSKIGAVGGAAIGSAVPVVGTAAGGAVGGILGGIAGYMGGNKLGESIANSIDFSGISSKFSDTISDMQASWSNNAQYLDDVQTNFKSSLGSSWDEICQTIAAKNQEWSQSFADAKEYAGSMLDDLGSWASNVWQSISDGAYDMGSSIQSAFSDACSAAESAWDGITGWFDENIWGPLKQGASNAWPGISDTVSSIKSTASNIQAPSFNFNIPGFATGSSYFGGGLAQINEHGGEIVDLPSGSRIYPSDTTERMLRNQSVKSGYQSQQPVVIQGNTFYVREEADIDKVAHKLARLIQQGSVNYGGGY